MVSTAESAGPVRRVNTAFGNVRLAETLAKAEDAHRLKKRSAELLVLQRASCSPVSWGTGCQSAPMVYQGISKALHFRLGIDEATVARGFGWVYQRLLSNVGEYRFVLLFSECEQCDLLFQVPLRKKLIPGPTILTLNILGNKHFPNLWRP